MLRNLALVYSSIVVLMVNGCGGSGSSEQSVPAASGTVATLASLTVAPVSLTELARTLQPPHEGPLLQKSLAQGNTMRAGMILLAAGQTLASHYHPAHEEVFYVLQGSAHLTLGVESYSIRPGDFVYIPVGLGHALTASAEQDLILYCNTAPPVSGDGRVPLAPGNPGPVALVSHPPIATGPVAAELTVPPGSVRADHPLALGKDLQAGVVRVPPGAKLTDHVHPFHDESVMVLQGTGIMRLGDRDYPVKAGDFFFMPAGLTHGLEAGSEQGIVVYCQTAPPASDSAVRFL